MLKKPPEELYLKAWEIGVETINWNAALTLGAMTVVIFYLSIRPVRWSVQKMMERDNAVDPTLGHITIGVLASMVMVAGLSLATAMLGILAAGGLLLVGIDQSVIQPGREVGYVQLVDTGTPREVITK